MCHLVQFPHLPKWSRHKRKDFQDIKNFSSSIKLRFNYKLRFLWTSKPQWQCSAFHEKRMPFLFIKGVHRLKPFYRKYNSTMHCFVSTKTKISHSISEKNILLGMHSHCWGICCCHVLSGCHFGCGCCSIR